MPAPASLYVHAPFCRARCGYCAFFSTPVGPAGPDPALLERYLAALEAEAGQMARAWEGFRAGSLFLGGGTPSLLGAAGLARVLAILRARFDMDQDAELSLEANPDSATPEFLSAARGLGVTRLSLGVQSLDDAELAGLGRVHTAAQAVAAYSGARAAGFANVGLDLIFGLPGQGVEAWLATLRRAADLGPEHLSCYALGVEPGTPLAADASALARLPDEEAQAEMFLAGAELLESTGYRHYEVSNFARPGRECRHNLAGWRGGDVLGLGPAAVSTRGLGLAGLRWANPADIPAWEELVRSGRAGQAGREELSPQTRAREALMLALRTAEGLDLEEHARRFGADLRQGQAGLLEQLASAGLARLEGERLRLTRAGMLVSNSVIRALGFE